MSAGVFAYFLVGLLAGRMPRLATNRADASVITNRQLWLVQAGVSMTPTQFWAISGLGSAIALVMGIALSGTPRVALAPALATLFLPRWYYGRRRAARLGETQQAWPDGIRHIIGSVRAGMSLPLAIEEMTRTGPDPLRTAFERYSTLATVFGVQPALESIRDDLGDPTTDRIIEVLIVAHERGGPLTSEILTDLAEATTADLRAIEEIRTNALEQQLNARIVFAVPWFVLLLLTIPDGAFRDFYAGQPAGLLVIVIGGILSAVGFLILRRLGPRRCRGAGLRCIRRGSLEMSELLGIPLFAAALAGLSVSIALYYVVRPRTRLAIRTRPYSVVSRSALGRPVEFEALRGGVSSDSTLWRLFGPPVLAVADALGGVIDSVSGEGLARKIRQAGLFATSDPSQRVQEYRVRQLGLALTGGGVAFALAALLGVSPLMRLLFLVLGLLWGGSYWRGKLDSAIDDPRTRMRIELYTVNQLLAMRIRVGGGVISAVRDAVERGRGAVIDDLAEALRMHQGGMSAGEAFRRIGEFTPEPHAKRTYLLLATADERGSDLAGALLALSHDIRDDRREALRRRATKRRAAMLFPIIAILAPILIMFVAAPLPWIIFGELR